MQRGQVKTGIYITTLVALLIFIVFQVLGMSYMSWVAFTKGPHEGKFCVKMSMFQRVVMGMTIILLWLGILIQAYYIIMFSCRRAHTMGCVPTLFSYFVVIMFMFEVLGLITISRFIFTAKKEGDAYCVAMSETENLMLKFAVGLVWIFLAISLFFVIWWMIGTGRFARMVGRGGGRDVVLQERKSRSAPRVAPQDIEMGALFKSSI